VRLVTRGGSRPRYHARKVRMRIDDGCRLVRSPLRGLSFVACNVAVLGIVGCTDALRAGTHGSGGAMATGGQAGSDAGVASGGSPGAGGTPLGGSRSGGASGSTGGAGGAAGTDACPELGYEYCVENCFKEYALSDNPSCNGGAWVCRSGWVLKSTCPDQACGVTPDACCDLTTGLVSANACAKTGYRASCPDGNMETYAMESWCVPSGLVAPQGCASLDRQPCTGPAVGCSDLSGGFVNCRCTQYGTDASSGIWYCSYFIGP
jgi:hypothetical protein